MTKFREDFIDLPTALTSNARASRDFLYSQIVSLASGSTILTANTISFGSFARRTKMKPLDDIDCLVKLDAAFTTEYYASSRTYNLYAPKEAPLWIYSDDNGYVSSTKILNAVKRLLESVAQYKQSNVGRNGSAVVLDLKSYDWSFDLVPACEINATPSYFLIPDGYGQWKRTDPRIDARRVESTSSKHNGHFLRAVRIMKYWNRRGGKTRMPSYYFETLLTNRALTQNPYPSLQNAVADLMYGLRDSILYSCPDPKGYEIDLELTTTYDARSGVYAAANTAYSNLSSAITFEIANDHKSAISLYRTVFGTDFPAYG